PGRRQGSPIALGGVLAAFPRAGKSSHARAAGLFGAARGFALLQLTRSARRPLVCVVPDEEAAEALERDLRFFFDATSAEAREGAAAAADGAGLAGGAR